MPQETTEIEVEVLEIDGVAPAPPKETPQSQAEWQDWRQWGGRVRRLDSRWWPLWVVLGGIALFLALTVGLVLGLLYTVFRIIRGFFRAIFG
jgi:hypothetical protein